VAQALAERDKLDSTRAASPLQIALGATVVDNSANPPDRTVGIILEQIQKNR
jgi:cytidylate kinase